MKYFYKGTEVQLVPGQQFSTHWNIYFNQPTENGGTIRRIVSGQPGKDIELRGDDEVAPQVEIEGLPKSLNILTVTPTVEPININTADFNSIRGALAGVGRASVRTIIKNKPVNGYANFSQLVDLNSNVQAQWEIIEPLLKFEG